MQLNEMRRSKKSMLGQALKENFGVKLDYSRLDASRTGKMLSQVTDLLREARNSGGGTRYTGGSYMKLVMMEQALQLHLRELVGRNRIVLENEEVQKSQVILAAQDLVDSVQKMIEQISKMRAEELPAVVTGIGNEIGTTESEQFNSTVGELLGGLETSLMDAKNTLAGAVGTITGEGPGAGEFQPDMGGDLEQDDMGGDMGGDAGEEATEPVEELPAPVEEPEDTAGPAGRGLR